MILTLALSISGTIIDIAPTDQNGAVAVVTIDNAMTNGPEDDGTYTIPFDGLTVGIQFTWDSGPWGQDQVTVTPPDGFTCLPVDCIALVGEGQIGRILLIPWVGS